MMRHRPDLWRRRDGGGRHDRPFRRNEASHREIRRQSNKRPGNCSPSGLLLSSATPHRMSRSDTSKPSSANAPETSSRITAPATIVGARAGSRPLTSRRSASGKRGQPVAQLLEPLARRSRGPRPGRGRARRARGRSRRAASPCRRRRSPPPAAPAHRRAPRPRTRPARPRPARRARGRRRIGVQVALAVADDADLRRDVEVELGAGADDELGRAAADVDHEHGLAAVARGRRAERRQARLLVARQRRGPRARSGRARWRRTRRRWRRRGRRRS